MRCSSCESLLAGYLDGALSPRRTADVARHLHRCGSCAALIEELGVVDALLSTATPAQLPPNFTFAVMAHVRTMPAPRRSRSSIGLAVAGYLVAAWAVAGLWFFFRGTAAYAALGRALAPVADLWSAFSATVTAAAHAVAPNAAILGATVGTVLAFDAIALVALFYFYRSVRPRIRAAVTFEVRR